MSADHSLNNDLNENDNTVDCWSDDCKDYDSDNDSLYSNNKNNYGDNDNIEINKNNYEDNYDVEVNDNYNENDDTDDDAEINNCDEDNDNKNNEILSTDGISENDINYKKLKYVIKKTLKKCDMCGKKYTDDMIIDITNNDEYTCYHCFFWINYDLSLRDIADNAVNITIAEYILKCKDDHNIALCTRHTEHGGCFLCEYKSGFPIINIRNSTLIYQESKDEKEVIITDDDICNDIPNANEIVIEL